MWCEQVATKNNDVQLPDFIESEFLDEHVESHISVYTF